MPDHKKLWDDWREHYYLELLDGCLNDVPLPPKPFTEMDEAQLNTGLSKIYLTNSNNNGRKEFTINVPAKRELCLNTQSSKTNIVHLPLSLEDNSTLNGTAAILEEFGKEFSIPCPQRNAIPFHKADKKFDLLSARTQYDFIKSVNDHHVEMSEMEKQITSCEKELDGSTWGDTTHFLESDSDSSDDDNPPEKEKTSKERKDEIFTALYKIILKQIHDSDSGVDYRMDNLIQELTRKRNDINDTKDRYDRTIFHAAVEESKHLMAKILLAVGININSKEGCGATPLCIAVMNADIVMCKLLLDNFAEQSGPLFGTIPSPMEIAVAMELTDIVELFIMYMLKLMIVNW